MKRPQIAIMVGSKGRGSNMAVLLESCNNGTVSADVATVVSPVTDSPAVQLARARGARVIAISPKETGYAAHLLEEFENQSVDWICLAGLMTKLPGEIVQHYDQRILNIHPSLLPRHGGKGMFGHHVHEAVLASGELETGCTVHYVTENYDEGQVILQSRCPVLPGDTPQVLAVRVLALEHATYPEALRMVISDNGPGC